MGAVCFALKMPQRFFSKSNDLFDLNLKRIPEIYWLMKHLMCVPMTYQLETVRLQERNTLFGEHWPRGLNNSLCYLHH